MPRRSIRQYVRSCRKRERLLALPRVVGCIEAHSAGVGTLSSASGRADRALTARPQAQDVADGYVSDSAITAQMGVLNSVYNAVGFGFSLAGVDRTLNADWFQNLQSNTQEEADMTTALHKGNASVVGAHL